MTNTASIITASRLCHRHWVLGPLFLSAVVFSSFLSLSVSVPPQVASKKEEEVLVQDAGMITVHRHDLSLYGMHGAFTVSEKAGRVSVAALTTPVLVRGADVLSIVPIGFQWRSDDRNVILPLPLAFQYAKLQELSDAPLSPPLARWSPSLLLPGALRLPAAKQRQEDRVRQRHLLTVARQIARGRSIARVVQDDATSAALVSREGYRIVPSFLAELKDSPLDRAALFPFLTEKEEGAFLALFHPSFRDQAAIFALDGLSPEVRVVYHRTLPSADLLPEALSPLAVSRWEDDVARTFAELSGPLPLFAELLDTIERVVQAQRRYGYVERAQRYTAAMQHFATLVELTPELRERLDALSRLSLVSDQTIPPVV
ncbi:hypothetical protein HYW11_01385, partial [Candidatus Peregrinibacteria bacterium]|nr:hypothetical protein [Candidatus Peregrinibacteria bacterium]